MMIVDLQAVRWRALMRLVQQLETLVKAQQQLDAGSRTDRADVHRRVTALTRQIEQEITRVTCAQLDAHCRPLRRKA